MNKEDRKDLVERLRKEADWLVSCACGNIPDDARLWIDAADEIDRLRRELEEARKALWEIAGNTYDDTAEKVARSALRAGEEGK